jgi:hypothetical protein
MPSPPRPGQPRGGPGSVSVTASGKQKAAFSAACCFEFGELLVPVPPGRVLTCLWPWLGGDSEAGGLAAMGGREPRRPSKARPGSLGALGPCRAASGRAQHWLQRAHWQVAIACFRSGCSPFPRQGARPGPCGSGFGEPRSRGRPCGHGAVSDVLINESALRTKRPGPPPAPPRRRLVPLAGSRPGLS